VIRYILQYFWRWKNSSDGIKILIKQYKEGRGVDRIQFNLWQQRPTKGNGLVNRLETHMTKKDKYFWSLGSNLINQLPIFLFVGSLTNSPSNSFIITHSSIDHSEGYEMLSPINLHLGLYQILFN